MQVSQSGIPVHCSVKMRKSIYLLFILIIQPVYFCFSQIQKTDSIPVFPDIYYEYKIAGLAKKTPLDLEFNPLVKNYIDKYTLERREDVKKYLGLSKLYFPIFESYLDKYNLPLELKYLAIVESGLDPLAKSSSGAVGLWQFLLNTSRMFDLTVDSYLDERSDIYKSTDAACKYFVYLYNTYHDWNLVLQPLTVDPVSCEMLWNAAVEKQIYGIFFPIFRNKHKIMFLLLWPLTML